MTCWKRGSPKDSAIEGVASDIPLSGVTRSLKDADFKWPNISEICAVQNKHKAKAPSDTAQSPYKLLLAKGEAWIPNDAVDIKLRNLFIARAGKAGQRDAELTWQVLRKKFLWGDQRNDNRDFASSCLLCVKSKSGNKVPCPLLTTVHASRPNEVIHFNYVFLGQCAKQNKYAPVVKDDLSGYAWLEQSASADSQHAAEVLSRWTRVFPAPDVWVSD